MSLKNYEMCKFNIEDIVIGINAFVYKQYMVCGVVLVKVDDKVRYVPMIDEEDRFVDLVKGITTKYLIEIATKNELIAEIELEEEAYLLINRITGGEIKEWIDALYIYRRLKAK